MSKNTTNFSFQRTVSQTSSGSGGALDASSGYQDLNQSKKKSSRSKGQQKDPTKSKQGAGYLISRGQMSSTVGLCGNATLGEQHNQRNSEFHSKRILAKNVNMNNLDIGSEKCPGIMSVTDIELTMGEEEKPPELPESNWLNHQGSISANSAQAVSSAGEAGPRHSVDRSSSKTLPTKCPDDLCDNPSCGWHMYVMDRPNRVKWMDTIVKVELRRKQDEPWPGFDHKLNRHKKKDEYYAIVTRISKEGIAANSGLCVGDLILSINNIPLQDKTIHRIAFEQEDILILQIQHPQALYPQTAKVGEGHIGSVGSWTISQEGRRLQQPLSPTSSPSDVFVNPSPNCENIPLYPLLKPIPDNRQFLPQATLFVCGNAATEFARCLVGDKINNFFLLNSYANCFGISMKISPHHFCSSIPSNYLVEVDNWESFSYLFRETEVKALSTANSQTIPMTVMSCINVRLVIVEDDNFFYHCCPWLFSSRSMFILTFDANRLLSSSELEMSRLKRIAYTVRAGMAGVTEVREASSTIGVGAAAAQFSTPASPRSNSSPLMIVGVTSQESNLEEIHALFYTSLGETLGRPDVIHTRQDYRCPELSKLRQDIFVRLNQCSSNTFVVSPRTPPCSPLSGPAWSVPCTQPKPSNSISFDSFQRTPQLRIKFATAVALDIIATHQSLTIFHQQLVKTLKEWCQSPFLENGSVEGVGTGQHNSTRPLQAHGSGLHHQESAFAQVIEDLRCSKNLILMDSLSTGRQSEDEREYVLPAKLFDKLLHLAQRSEAPNLSESHQNTLRCLSSRGIISRQGLLNLLSLVGSQPEKLLVCLEDLQMIFPVKTGQQPQQQEQDSGFEDGLSLMFPFFKEDVPFDPNCLEGFEQFWTIEFSVEVPLASFYSILADISLHWPPGVDLSLQSQLVAQVFHVTSVNGLPNHLGEVPQQHPKATAYIICFQQPMRQIQAFKKRINSCGGGGPLYKETQMAEHLSPASVLAIAESRVAGHTEIHCHHSQRPQPQWTTLSPVTPFTVVGPRGQPLNSGVMNLSPLIPHSRYSGDFQVPLPIDLVMDEEQEQAAAPVAGAMAGSDMEERDAQTQIMGRRVAEFFYVDTELTKIHRFLSVQEDWKVLAGELGLSYHEVEICMSLLPSRPNVPAGQVFLESCMSRSDFTLRRLLRALLNMSETMGRTVYNDLAHELWTAALLNNSQYYIDRRGRQNMCSSPTK